MCDYTIHGHLEQGLLTCQVSLIMAHFLAGVGRRKALIFTYMGKLSINVWLTGTFSHVIPSVTQRDQGSPPNPGGQT